MPTPVVESKPWYLSKTIIGVVVGVVASALAYFTKNPAIEAGVEAESANITSIIAQGVALVSAVVAIIGRVKASATIGK